MNAVEFDRVCIVFGDHPDRALPLMDEGLDRGPIKTETGQVLGVHDCSLSVADGEILVLMGLSGSGKSTLLRAVNALNPVCRGEVRIKRGGQMVSVTAAGSRALRDIRLRDVAMVFQPSACCHGARCATMSALGWNWRACRRPNGAAR